MPENPIEFAPGETVLEASDKIDPTIAELITDGAPDIDEESLTALASEVKANLDQIEAATDRKTTIDSITTTVPSTQLNTLARNAAEAKVAEQERLRRRHLGF